MCEGYLGRYITYKSNVHVKIWSCILSLIFGKKVLNVISP